MIIPRNIHIYSNCIIIVGFPRFFHTSLCFSIKTSIFHEDFQAAGLIKPHLEGPTEALHQGTRRGVLTTCQ